MTISVKRDGQNITVDHSPTGASFTEDAHHMKWFHNELGKLLGEADAEKSEEVPK